MAKNLFFLNLGSKLDETPLCILAAYKLSKHRVALESDLALSIWQRTIEQHNKNVEPFCHQKAAMTSR